MARMPSYFKFHDWHVADGHLIADITIRKWHPGWWLLLASAFISVMRKCRLVITIRGKEFTIGAKG